MSLSATGFQPFFHCVAHPHRFPCASAIDFIARGGCKDIDSYPGLAGLASVLPISTSNQTRLRGTWLVMIEWRAIPDQTCYAAAWSSIATVGLTHLFQRPARPQESKSTLNKLLCRLTHSPRLQTFVCCRHLRAKAPGSGQSPIRETKESRAETEQSRHRLNAPGVRSATQCSSHAAGKQAEKSKESSFDPQVL